MQRALIVVAVLVLATVVQWAVYYPALPETVASHFNGAGTPNGWSTKDTFFMVIGAVLGTELVFLVGLPLILGRLPVAIINLPHRDYWLAPKRRAQSLAAIGARLVWFAAASLMLALVVVQDVVLANLDASVRLSSVTPVALVAYLAFAVLWLIALFRRFKLPAPSAAR
jgi:uncharacterized membrane protein